MFLFYASDSHRPDSSALALWSLMTIRRRSSSAHPMLFDAQYQPRRRKLGGRRLLFLRQRERSCMPVWHLLFVGCLTRVRTDTSTCNSSTCSPVETRHPQVNAHQVISIAWCTVMIAHFLTNSKQKLLIFWSLPGCKLCSWSGATSIIK